MIGRLRDAGREVRADVVADVQLVVSELVTNAVKHTDGPCGVDLRVDGDILEITVWDTSGAPVTAMAADPARVGQHGLEIVQSLCGGFDTEVTPRGKRITARMALGPTAPAG